MVEAVAILYISLEDTILCGWWSSSCSGSSSSSEFSRILENLESRSFKCMANRMKLYLLVALNGNKLLYLVYLEERND